MTRAEAIKHLGYINGLAEAEFRMADDGDQWGRELVEALVALGVTADELDETDRKYVPAEATG